MINIAIDGPAGAGKSTIAKAVSKELGFVYVDTGAMYRAIGIYLSRLGIDPSDEAAIDNAMPGATVDIKYIDGAQRVFLGEEDVTGLLRTEEAGNMASSVSRFSSVRTKLTQLQKDLAVKQNVVMDGRDIGSAVLPNAEVKIYLTASEQARGERRYKELTEKGEKADLNTIIADIAARDHQDMTREISPLVQAEDAILLDSSDMNIEEVINAVLGICRTKGVID
ncbi:MAG: (d)CMP kinase [Lachnospiraceae bacterium]|nr:(d)CMP kinase [Lachnospiraceae bacterium]